MKRKTNLILADCVPQELTDLRDELEQATGESWGIHSRVSNWGRTSRWAEIKRYLMYFAVPFEIFCKRKKIDTILGWQQFYALIFSFFCSVFHVKKTTRVIVVNFVYKEKKGFVGKLYRRFMARSLKEPYVDLLCVSSREAAERYAREFSLNTDKILVIPFGVPDLYETWRSSPAPRERYALAIGRSNRDYDWLLSQWQGIDLPLVVICDTYTPQSLPQGVELIKDVSGDGQYPYLANCEMMILPIGEPGVCSGDTVLLTAMSFAKNVLVTAPSTLAEMYIRDGENGFLVSKTPGELQQVVHEILSAGKDLGSAARESYLRDFSRKKMGKVIGDWARRETVEA